MSNPSTPQQLRSLSRSHGHPDFQEIAIQRDLKNSVKLAHSTIRERPDQIVPVAAPRFYQNQQTRLRINQVYNKRRSFSSDFNFDYKGVHKQSEAAKRLFQQTHSEARAATMKEMESVKTLYRNHQSTVSWAKKMDAERHRMKNDLE